MAYVNDTTLARRCCLCYSVITMEKTPTTQQALSELRLQARDSSILSTVLPLFNTLNYRDEYYPDRVSEQNEYTQLLWKKGELQKSEFEQICLTLSKATLSMTIALNHRHDSTSDGTPTLPRSVVAPRSNSSLVISTGSCELYETNPTNGVLLGNHYDIEAISRFRPELTHTLAIIGLYGYGQDMQREVS